jgi:NTE family protein
VFRNLLLATAAALAVAACAADALNLPINAGLASVTDQGCWPQAAQVDDTIVGLAFSGGGTRAAAFSHGVLSALDRETIRTGAGPRPLTEAVDFVAGVSGGSVTAAYFGLKGRDGLAVFRSRFLERNAGRASTPRSRSAMSSRS